MSDSEIASLRAMIVARPRASEIAQMRLDIDRRGKDFGLAADVTVQTVDAHGVRAEWTSTPDADRSSAILYLHGGGYVIGSLDSHRHVAAEVGRASGARTLAVDYRLAPEHPFPAAVEDTLAAYRYLLESDIQPKHIALAGDSAGGGLVVGALLAIREAGLPLPGCGWCISPWVDMEALGASLHRSGRHRSDRAEGDDRVDGTTVSRRRRSAPPACRANLRRSPRAAAAADPGWRGRNVAGRFTQSCPQGRRRRCRGRSADLAGNDPCVAFVFPAAVGRSARHRRRWFLCP